MNSTLHTWAQQWGVPIGALNDLQLRLGLLTPPMPDAHPAHGKSEAYVQSAVRLEASQKGLRLFRNNVGALKDAAGRVVRYGLANESSAVNSVIKSGDLIGLRTICITQQHVGHNIAQFVSREIKAPGWQYTGSDREPAQAAWIALVNSMGGDAAFASDVGTL